MAKENGAEVALSLSDAFCVERHRDSFLELVDGHVDILFANEMEITSLYKANSFDEAAQAVRGRCRIAALTRSAIDSSSCALHVGAAAAGWAAAAAVAAPVAADPEPAPASGAACSLVEAGAPAVRRAAFFW